MSATAGGIRLPRGPRRAGMAARAVPALMLLAACNEYPLEGFFVSEQEPVPVTVRTTTLAAGPFPDLVLTASQDTLFVNWWIGTGSPCYSFTASGRATADTLIATVVATRVPVGCTAAIAGFAYTLTIPGIPEGTTTLELVHEFRGGPDSTATAAIRRLT